jgi:hypothetical protein
MRIVRFAPRFPYLCSVLAALIVLLGYAAIRTMPTDFLVPPDLPTPVVVQFNASSVPVPQLSLSSDTRNKQQLYDDAKDDRRRLLLRLASLVLLTAALAADAWRAATPNQCES